MLYVGGVFLGVDVVVEVVSEVHDVFACMKRRRKKKRKKSKKGGL
jgi:hypothetical protein